MAVGMMTDIAVSTFDIKLHILPLRWQHFSTVQYLSINVSCLHNNFEFNGVRYLYELF
jgi:hypothetical protein